MIANESSEPRDFRLEAYQYLKKNQRGFRDDVIEEITEPLFSEFCNVGILSEGLDGNWKARYKVTDFGIEQIDSILKIESLKGELLSIAQKYFAFQ